MISTRVVTPELVEHLRERLTLDWQGIHGAPHWARVQANGLRLAEETGAQVRVVEAFAFLHDSCRRNDNHDPMHGPRAAQLARELHGGLPKLAHEELALLVFACEGHSDGGLAGDVTVLTCWDADRLDLGRVGVRPHPSRLCTEAARRNEMVDWAYRRSVAGSTSSPAP